MIARHGFPIALLVACATAAGAANMDGSRPIQCRAEQAYDCLPNPSGCQPLKRGTSIDPVFEIDFAKGRVRSPFRADALHAAHQSSTAQSLILQGTGSMLAWSAVIQKATRRLTISIADRQGAYVAFGQCWTVEPK